MSTTVAFTTDPGFTHPEWSVILIDQADDDRRVIAAARALLAFHESVTIAGHGLMGRLVPRLAFARRAARQPVAGYLLIDCDLPAAAGDWPDAPVTFMATAPDFATHLKVASSRGWRVINLLD